MVDPIPMLVVLVVVLLLAWIWERLRDRQAQRCAARLNVMLDGASVP
jgi:Flp pilus assembly protein TadB